MIKNIQNHLSSQLRLAPLSPSGATTFIQLDVKGMACLQKFQASTPFIKRRKEPKNQYISICNEEYISLPCAAHMTRLGRLRKSFVLFGSQLHMYNQLGSLSSPFQTKTTAFLSIRKCLFACKGIYEGQMNYRGA